MNQIYLGQRAYGFSSAAQIYFGKQLKDISIAEAAMLAGLPKAPSAYNPVVNPKRAKARQQYILLRMYQLGHISQAQYEQAQGRKLHTWPECLYDDHQGRSGRRLSGRAQRRHGL
jgi:penicillin-binding protein 1A